MTKTLQRLAVVFPVLFLAGTAGAASVVAGSPAPDFALQALDGKNLRLSEYRPDVVVLNFWAAWCKRCGDALPALNSIYLQHQAAGLQMLAVGVDVDHPQTTDFLAAIQTAFPLLADDALHTVSKTYDLGKLPLTLVIDREGNVRYIHEGYDDSTGPQIEAQVAALLTE